MEYSERIDRKRYRRKKAKPLGIVIFILALIGLIGVIFMLRGVVSAILGQSNKSEQYEKFIAPVVMMDPVPFNNIQNTDDQFILQTALWAALLGENRSNYSYDENGMLLVPSTELDVSAVRLFGPNCIVNHHSFDDYDATYLFDADINAYRVPLIGKVAYSPKVTSIMKVGDTTTLKVGYIAPGNVWTTDVLDEKTEERAPDKYMYYDLVKGEGGMYIKSIRDVESEVYTQSQPSS